MSRRRHDMVYYSLDEYVEAADKGRDKPTWTPHTGTDDKQWAGGFSREDMKHALKQGWPEGMAKAAPIRREALADIRREAPVTRFTSRFDVAGSHVDMGRYLSGHPENMRRPIMQPISRVGRVVTLVASVCYSAAVKAEHALEQSAMVTALAMALQDTGHATDLWVDITVGDASIRIQVKGPHDVLDPERMAAAYHPAMLRQLSFDVEHLWRPNGIRGGYPVDPDPENYPEGAIILPSLRTGSGYGGDGKRMAQIVKDHLVNLGLME